MNPSSPYVWVPIVEGPRKTWVEVNKIKGRKIFFDKGHVSSYAALLQLDKVSGGKDYYERTINLVLYLKALAEGYPKEKMYFSSKLLKDYILDRGV